MPLTREEYAVVRDFSVLYSGGLDSCAVPLIIGANTVSLAAGNETFSAGIWALSAYAVGTLSLAPYATAAALRISNE